MGATAAPLQPGLPAPARGVRVAGHVVVLSGLALAAVVGVVLVGFDGWDYYRAPVAERSFMPANRFLRPSAPVGHLLGIGGFLMMLVPVAYAVRKKVRRLRNFGSMQTWLEVHIFSGIVGPGLITLHTSFKFNGLVSVAYWSMVAVMLSGFVGRYLYVRIPRSLRGHELSRAELDARASALADAIAAAMLPPRVLAEIEAFEHRALPAETPTYLSLFVGEWRMRREVTELRRGAARRGELHAAAIALIAERATLLRRMAYLQKTKALFDLWHVFHMPLVYVMFAIVVVHVAVTLYMGYVPFVD